MNYLIVISITKTHLPIVVVKIVTDILRVYLLPSYFYQDDFENALADLSSKTSKLDVGIHLYYIHFGKERSVH